MSASLAPFYGIAGGCAGGGLPSQEGVEETFEQSLATTSDIFSQFTLIDADSVVVLDTVAAAKVVCFRALGRRESVSGKWGIQPAQPLPAQVRLKFGDGRLAEVRRAADIPAGLSGGRRNFTVAN